MKFKSLVSVIILGSLLSCNGSCGGNPDPTPTPTPVPTPTPTPVPNSPKVVNGKWSPFLRGAINCCDFAGTPNVDEGLADGWSLVTAPALDRIKASGTVNFTHVRLGPFSAVVDSSIKKLNSVDKLKARRIQVSVQNYGPGPGILDDATITGQLALERGIYLEWDVVDNWALITEGMNFFGDNCQVTKSAPPERYIDWVNAVVEATWQFPGIYNLGNEGSRCNPSEEWEVGLYNAIKSALRAKGVDRPVGSNVSIANKRTSFDYRTYHGWSIPPATWSEDIPAMLTETDNDSYSADEWIELTEGTESRGMYVSIWRGPDSWESHNAAIGGVPRLDPPTPTPTPDPTPTPEPTPTPITGNCPKELAPGSLVYMASNYYAQGMDSTVRVRGDSEFCFLIHGVNTNDCHLEGWPKRVECEMELISGCPVWDFSIDGGATALICHDNHNDFASCDHFGNTEFRDDPQTPDVFEGRPLECGLQKDEFGPIAGFFVIAHGNAILRACKPDRNPSTCSPWKSFNH